MEKMETTSKIENIKPEKILFVERRPSAHPLFNSLSEYEVNSKEKTAAERLQDRLRDLEKVAMSGDLKAWNSKVPEVTAQAREANADPSKDLNTLVQIKKLELTVMFQAASKAKVAAKHLEEEATKAQMKKETDRSRKLLTQAQNLNRLADQLKNQLMSKTS